MWHSGFTDFVGRGLATVRNHSSPPEDEQMCHISLPLPLPLGQTSCLLVMINPSGRFEDPSVLDDGSLKSCLDLLRGSSRCSQPRRCSTAVSGHSLLTSGRAVFSETMTNFAAGV
ncbi:hypothetical protein BOX37_12825 [Nocardia mangyaensis]|uniref:Uncharacterized protein n=1 Tax=Nocardia mangyaensis TaxID=2213200 RepID=A0A1J0VRL9_9NOCA|nr:hypothetical protein BOX37_12825 [Nocardia mangyaensis]